MPESPAFRGARIQVRTGEGLSPEIANRNWEKFVDNEGETPYTRRRSCVVFTTVSNSGIEQFKPDAESNPLELAAKV